MMRHSSRGTLVFLLVVGAALALTIAAGEVPSEVGAVLIAAYLGLALLFAGKLPVGAAWQNLTTRDQELSQATEVAKEAQARARGYPNYDALIQLLDVGLIVDEQRPDGMLLRRGRFISLDDDAIRPFAIIRVPEGLAGRLGHIRFELRDGGGKLHYAFEDEKWLEPGENPLLPDYRFPIQKKASELESGGWSARIFVDEGLLGVHNFNMSPPLSSRRQMIGSDGEIMRERVWRSPDEDESLPLSLEELLRQQSRQSRSS